MSISITTLPKTVVPVYNPIWYNVSSTNTAQPNFKYVFQLFTGTTSTGTPLSTIKLLPRPNTTTCLYNPSRILESVLSYDKNLQNITSATTSINNITSYTVNMGEEYGLLSTGTTIYSGLTISTGYTFNGVLQYNQIPTWDYNQYNVSGWALGTGWSFLGNSLVKVAGIASSATYQGILIANTTYTVTIGYVNITNGSLILKLGTTIIGTFTTSGVVTATGISNGTDLLIYGDASFDGDFDVHDLITTSSTGYEVFPSKFLTNQPQGLTVKNSTDRGTLSFMNTSLLTRYWNVWVTHSDSTVTWTQFKCNSYTGTTPDNRVIHIPSGPWNINNVPASERIFGVTGLTDVIDVCSDLSYLIFTEDINGLNSEYRQYDIETRASRYETVRVQFLNRLGGWDYFNFNLVSRKSINGTNRTTYKKPLAYNYAVGDREKTVIDVSGSYVYSVTCDWLNDATIIWLEELFLSNEVYFIGSDGVSTPVIGADNNFDILKSANKKLNNYVFNFTSSSNLNTIRG